MHTRTLAIAVCLLAACFRPSDGTTPIRCDSQNPCPDGQSCQAGLCAAAMDLGAAGSDMAATASVGCANAASGQKLTDRVWACPGAFGMGEARNLCAVGWAVCKDLLDLAPAACEAGPNFFIADVPAYRPGTNPIVCATTTIYQRFLGGCGAVPPFSGVTFDSTCTKFRNFAVDQYGGYDFRQGHSIDKAISTSPQNGVLCCQ